MPHVSHNKLREEDFNKIYVELVSFFNVVGKNNKTKIFIDEFFTKTEKTMFSKRLAIIFMLSEGISIHYISQTLLVSPSTVARISLNYEIGKYFYISKITKENKKNIWSLVRELVMIGLTPRVGSARWKWFDQIDKKYSR